MGDLPYIRADLSDLFRAKDSTRCDACNEALTEDDGAEGGAEGFQVRGKGLYMWTRGDHVRFEEPVLCHSCGAAIGLSALARWEIEEEEG
jgi:hypothetical protein